MRYYPLTHITAMSAKQHRTKSLAAFLFSALRLTEALRNYSRIATRLTRVVES